MSSFYAVALIVSLTCLVLFDYRYKLVWFNNWRQALKVLTPVYVLFIVWDLLGIHYDIFYMGQSKYILGWQVLPHVPPEEFLFLGLLIYLPLLVWQYLKKVRHV